MLREFQKTLKEEVEFKGIGLHSGEPVQVTCLPADANSGIRFKRTDLDSKNIIQANFKNVKSANLCTVIQNKFGAKVSTVEHLMAALYGEGIDNLLVEINGPEMPIMDGSAKEFVSKIKSVGTTNLSKKAKYIKILKKVKIDKGPKFVSIEPLQEELKIDFKIKFNNKIINEQRETVDVHGDDLNSIYNSRTFCLYKDVEKIKKAGMAKGGSLENAIVVDDDKVLNEGGLRYENEFVKHKILDLMGDLMLCEANILGTVVCEQGGHQLTNELLNKIFSERSNWEYVDLSHSSERSTQLFSKPIAVGF